MLESLGQSYRNGDARVMPKNIAVTCRHCHLPALCRIAELSSEYGQIATEITENTVEARVSGVGRGGGGKDE